ncbi:cysteine hydrolase family protein [Arthrobacter sp. TE12232]
MNRALLVIDVQNEYISGNLPIGFPDPEVSLANIGKAIDAATEAGIPVIAVQQTAPETSPIFARGSHGFALHPVVSSRSHDHLIEKTLPSCFADTDLAEWLAERDIDTVVIAGYMTQNCDESTARDAAHRGLKVEFLSDATGTLAMSNHAGSLGAEQLHSAVLVVLQSRFASVLTTGEWIDAVEHGTSVPKPDIVASTQAGRDAAAEGRLM